MDFNPHNAVYRLPDDTLWSSARMGSIAADDPALIAWLDRGNEIGHCPKDETGTPTFAALCAMLASYGILADLGAYAAALRFARETRGVEIAGELVRTDRESQALIAGAHALALAEPDEPIDFKGASGWVRIDSAGMILIAQAVARHVRDCFRREAAAAAALVAGTMTTRAEIEAAFAD